MQYDPTKVDLSIIDANQHPSVNQFQHGTDSINQSYQPPPPAYSTHHQQPTDIIGNAVPSVHYYNQTPSYSQQHVIFIPRYVHLWKNGVSTKITPKLRTFLIISGLISLIWSLVTISLEIVIIFESYWIFYRSIWAGSFLFSGSICMLVAACHKSYPLNKLIKVLAFVLFFCIFGLISSAVIYSTSVKCSSPLVSKYLCDQESVRASQITILVIFAIANVQTLINIIVINNENKKSQLTAGPSNIQNH